MIQKIDKADLDPVVHEVAVRHLRALAITLRYVQAFGVDAALIAYSELIIRLRRAEQVAKPGTAKKMHAIWPAIKKLAGGLANLNKAINEGQELLEHGGAGLDILSDLADA